MITITRLKGTELDQQHPLLRELNKLCATQRLPIHCYAAYYLTIKPDRTEIITATTPDSWVNSYALVWHGGGFTIMDVYEIHLWKPTLKLVSKIKVAPYKRADIHLYNNESSDIDMVIKHFRSLGFRDFDDEEFHDMMVGPDTFKPSYQERLAVKLEEKHAQLYMDLELERGIEISIDEARGILREYTHYGVILNDTLVSIAARYITHPNLHILGGVFTRKNYRGKGYAKATTSALTREAVNKGIHVCLHVETGNRAAISVYRELGYKIIGTRTWIFAYPLEE